MEVVSQAVQDYINYVTGRAFVELEDYLTAKELLFDPEYMLWWGDLELSFEQICAVLDLDMDWFRERIIRREQSYGKIDDDREE